MNDVGEGVNRLRAEYDAAPYQSNSYPQSAPGHLAAIAHFFGLDVPDVAGARVLEIGCASGGNIVPFAASHPEAHVLGIDLSGVHIEQGRRLIQALGIDNLDLLEGDIATMDLTALGQFDFVIAHGVYSWVPPNVQEAILAAFRNLMAPDGVSYLSYNVYPGWKSKEILRDAMLLATRDSATPDEKVLKARRMVDLLEKEAKQGSVIAAAVAEFRASDAGAKSADFLLLHDELETFNAPCYFVDVLQRAGAHGLTFLAEARPESMLLSNYSPDVAEFVLQECGNVQVLVEQYLDFLANRTFRETLLVHGERAPQIRHGVDHSRYQRLHFAARMSVTEGHTRLDSSRQVYVAPNKEKLQVGDPRMKAAFDALTARWPWTLSRQELLDAVTARLHASGIDAAGANLPQLVDHVLDVLIFQGGARWRPDPVLPEPASAPLQLDEPIRRMVELTSAQGNAYTYNLWQELVGISALDAHLLPVLDGTRDGDALVEELMARNRANLLRVELAGKILSDEAQLRQVFSEHVAALPQRLEQMELLRVG